MIALIWVFIVLNLWLLALTVCLPFTLLVIVSKRFRAFWFSFFFVQIAGNFICPAVVPTRRRAFQLLKEHLKGRNESKKLEVVEIGIGPGANLDFYPANCNLTAVDKNPNFERYFRPELKKYPSINLKKVVIQPAENMSYIDTDSADVVVSTLLHCSCASSKDIIKEVHRILKPGGKYVFLDHVARSNSYFGLLAQKIINPLHYYYMNGCCLTRNPTPLVRKAGFTEVHIEPFEVKSAIAFLYGYEVVGIATK